MYNDSAVIMMFNTLTSTHPGSGTQLSYVDMPIQREGHTGYPKIEAATLKGCIRYDVNRRGAGSEELVNRIFGKPDNGDFASALSLTDARLLFFPVKSVRGVFGWITCPMVLERFFKEYRLAFGQKFPGAWKAEKGSVNSGQCKLAQKGKDGYVVMLEDYTYKVKESTEFTTCLEQIITHLPEDTITKDMIAERAVVLSDDDFAGFVKYSTEVNTRIKISPETGTVAGTALFTEEYLPPECVLYSLAFFSDSYQAQTETNGDKMGRAEVKTAFKEMLEESVIQVGANSGLGKGLMQVKIWEVN